MNVTKNLISIAVLGLASFAACAAGSSTGVIAQYLPLANGLVLVTSSGAVSGQPGCAASQPGRFVVDGNTQGGRIQIAALHGAWITQKTISFAGTGACNATQTDTENLLYPVLTNN